MITLISMRRLGANNGQIPDVVTETTAELAFALMLAVVRRVAEADRILRFKEDFRWGPMAYQ